jgi:hypothetical protein
MSRRLRLAIALVTLVAGLVDLALLLLAGDERPDNLAYLLIAIIGVGWSFAGAGLVAWTRRPGNRTGALMVAFGLANLLIGLLLNGVALLRAPLAFALWFLVATLPDAILGHLIAVFPDGRATTRLQRVFLVVNYTASVPLALVQVLLVDPASLGCPGCPDDLLGLGGRHPYGDAVLGVSDLGLAVVAALLLWIVVTRWREAPGPRRRSLAPVVLVGVALVAVYMAGQALKAVLSEPPPALEVVLSLAIVTLLMLWPLAFLAGLARTRLDRLAVGDLAVELSGPLPPGGLERALARALHDPTLRLAYWLPEREAFVDAAGRPVELPAGDGRRAVTVLRHDGDPVAALLHDAGLNEDPRWSGRWPRRPG